MVMFDPLIMVIVLGWGIIQSWPSFIVMIAFQCDDDNDTGDDEDDSDDILPFDHGHGPWERNPPELTKLALAFYLGKLFPEHWGDFDGDCGDDSDDHDGESYFNVYNVNHHDVYDVYDDVYWRWCFHLVANPASMRDWLSGNIPVPALFPVNT